MCSLQGLGTNVLKVRLAMEEAVIAVSFPLQAVGRSEIFLGPGLASPVDAVLGWGTPHDAILFRGFSEHGLGILVFLVGGGVWLGRLGMGERSEDDIISEAQNNGLCWSLSTSMVLSLSTPCL